MTHIQKIIEKAEAYAKVNTTRLHKAYDFAKAHHEGRFRKNGEPYIVHPLETDLIRATA